MFIVGRFRWFCLVLGGLFEEPAGDEDFVLQDLLLCVAAADHETEGVEEVAEVAEGAEALWGM